MPLGHLRNCYEIEGWAAYNDTANRHLEKHEDERGPWCKYAKECVGEELYNKLTKGRSTDGKNKKENYQDR